MVGVAPAVTRSGEAKRSSARSALDRRWSAPL